jgi:hypothetical protein
MGASAMTIEAAGDALTGSLIARAVEPGTGEDTPGPDGLTHERACLNCKATLIGGYCHVCGQHAHVHRTLGALAHDLLHGVFHFEGKVWRTVPMLFWRPGDLTRRYIHGERARFVSPLALFLFSVFLMFSVFESVGGPLSANVDINGKGAKSATELKAKIAESDRRLAILEKKRAAAITAKQSTTEIDDQIDGAQSYRAGIETAAVMSGKFDSADWSEGAQVDTGYPQFDDQIKKSLKNPKLLLYKLQSSAYKFSWALIPLSIPFMWLMFAWRRQYKLYDHAVFVTYSITFVMLLLVFMALIAAIGLQPGWALLIIPVHFYWQLRSAYALSIPGAVVRSVILVIASTLVMIVFAALLLWLGVSG